MGVGFMAAKNGLDQLRKLLETLQNVQLTPSIMNCHCRIFSVVEYHCQTFKLSGLKGYPYKLVTKCKHSPKYHECLLPDIFSSGVSC